MGTSGILGPCSCQDRSQDIINFDKKTVKFEGGWDLKEFTEICKQICEDFGEESPIVYTPGNDWYTLKPDFNATSLTGKTLLREVKNESGKEILDK